MSDEEQSNRRPRKGNYPQKRGDYLPEIHRTLPQNLDAEKGVLCSCLLSPDNVIDECASRLVPDAFYHPAHRLIYIEILAMRAELRPVDFITLTERLKNKGLPEDASQKQKDEVRGVLDQAGGSAAISELFTFVPTASNADYYIDIVAEKYLLRRLILTCTEFAGRAYDEQGEANVLLDEFEQKALTLGVNGGSMDDAMKPVEVYVRQAVESLEEVYKKRGKPVGIETGIHELDRMTGGLKRSLMYVIAGRPSHGKTVVGVNIAVHAAVNGIPVALFSLEMAGAELAERILGTRASVNLQRWRDGFLAEVDLPKITRASVEVSRSALHIDETGGMTIMELRARARRAVKRLGVKLIVIDYLQLLHAPSKRAEFSKQAEISDVSSGIKEMAKELNVPVVVLAQLNRDAESGRPKTSQLKESGSIEQDADLVAIIHRPWKDRKKTDEELADFKANGEPAELIVGKQRGGPIGDIDLKFRGEFTRFENVTKALYSNNPDKRQGGQK